jgi:tetratricopeptide (TPR) repeat protein
VSFRRALFTFLVAAWAASSAAQNFAELRARADKAREENRLADAVDLYRQALALNGDWQEGWWFLGSILYDTNRYSACRDAMTRLVALKPDAAPALGLLGLCEFQTGEYTRALAHIQRSLESPSPDHGELEPVLLYHEAILLTHAGEYDKAVQKYVWFTRQAPPNELLSIALGLAALRTPLLPDQVPAKDRDLYTLAGKVAFAQMTGDRAGAEAGFQTLLQRFPAAHHVHYLYGCSLLAANPDRAIREFQREIEITPASGGALGMLAWALLNRGDAVAALPYAERAVKSDPDYWLAQYVLGRSLVETGQIDRGIGMLERADKTDPANLETHLALAAAYPKAHRYEDARRERRLSLELTREGAFVAGQ